MPKLIFLKTFFAFFIISLLSLGLYIELNPKSSSLVSPVLGISKVSMADNIWLPRDNKENAEETLLKKITAKAAFFVDVNTGEVVFENNSRKRLPIASLTKIMTVLVTLDNKSFSDTLLVSRKAAETEPDKMLLRADEKLTVEELMNGIFLVSANDASEVFAEQSLGTGLAFSDSERAKNREEFVSLMNVKSKQLGMNDTLFINPSGLQEDNREQYSTAYDVSLMARYAIKKWPKLLEISSQPHIIIPQTDTHQDYDLYSGINLLTTYPGVMGFKTGYTPEAGLTLVTFARRENREVLGVILGATSRREDAKELLDYSFKKLGVKI